MDLLSSRPAWSTKRVPGQPGLYRETLSQKNKNKQKKTKQKKEGRKEGRKQASKLGSGTRKIVHYVKWLPRKHDDLSSEPCHPREKLWYGTPYTLELSGQLGLPNKLALG